MKNRRSFLRNVSVFSVGTILIPTVFSNESRAEVISTEGKGLALDNNADLRTSGLWNNHLIVKGIVYDKAGLVPHSNASVEVVLPATVKFPERIVKLNTNNKGEYKFLLDFPERTLGKSPRVNFNVASENIAYSTELIVTDFDAHISDKHWVLNRQLGDKLFPIKESFVNHSVVSFNLSI